jgi:general secretion pathway protein B
MSFILDALRKSEHDRQREKGPGLAEVPVAAPKPRKNIWASVAVGLLVVNLIAIGVLLLRRAGNGSTEANTPDMAVPTAGAPVQSVAPAPDDSTSAPAQGAGPAGAGTPAGPGGVYAGGTATPYPSQQVPGTVPPVLRPALPAADGGSHNPLADELSDNAAGGESGESYDPGYDGYQDGAPYPTAPPGVSGPPPGVGGSPSRRGSVVYETLPESEPVTSPARAAANAAARNPVSPAPGSVSSLPTLDDLGGQTGLPELRVELHIYSTNPAERFVFVNGHRYKEGDTLQEGPRVDRITADGAEMSYRGKRFVLPRQ